MMTCLLPLASLCFIVALQCCVEICFHSERLKHKTELTYSHNALKVSASPFKNPVYWFWLHMGHCVRKACDCYLATSLCAGTSYHERNTYSSLIPPTHEQQQTSKIRQITKVPLAVEGYQPQWVIRLKCIYLYSTFCRILNSAWSINAFYSSISA